MVDSGKLDGEKLAQLQKTMSHVLENVQHMNEQVFGTRFPRGSDEDRIKAVEDQLDNVMKVYLSHLRRVNDIAHAMDAMHGPRFEKPGDRLAKLEERLDRIQAPPDKVAEDLAKLAMGLSLLETRVAQLGQIAELEGRVARAGEAATLVERVAALEETVRKLGGKA
jgi:hypothetical protein